MLFQSSILRSSMNQVLSGFEGNWGPAACKSVAGGDLHCATCGLIVDCTECVGGFHADMA